VSPIGRNTSETPAASIFRAGEGKSIKITMGKKKLTE
jgi:hypothetical protein